MKTIGHNIGNAGPATEMWPSAFHPLREAIINELHARPFESLEPPVRGSHLAVITGESVETAQAQHDHFVSLCARYGVPPPAEGAKHFVHDLGPIRVRWERHTEFSTYTFLRAEPFAAPFVDPVINLAPRDWLQAIPGKVLIAAHVALEERNAPERDATALSRLFNHHNLIGCRVAGGNAMMWTDLRADENGFCRFLIRDIDLHRRQAGRSLQRLLEIHTYTSMALLALPVAQEVTPRISRSEAALADITQSLGVVRDLADERSLLAEITALAGEVERLHATTGYRFSASCAYYDLVQARLTELREQRAEDHQRLSTFLNRRLGPAMRTCESIRKRQEALAAHVARASNLLRTRVDVALESQNQDLLQSMNRRAQLQLRLQTTVEGLSVAAISYYVVGLIGDAARALQHVVVSPDPEVVMGIAIPFVVGIIWRGVRHVRRIADPEERRD